MSKVKVNNASYVATLDIGATKLKQVVWLMLNGLFFINPLNPLSFVKVSLLRLFGAKVGKGVFIKPSVSVKYPWKLCIGSNVWIGENVWIDNLCQVMIGDNVCISQGALLLTGSHDHTKPTFDFIANEIVLEEGVWIGAKAVVGGGVTCKSHSILGINSVAETDLNAYTIYKGNPAVPVIERKIF
ncbi:MAG: WcaF family extracellular polysaccharide biosynthesis acetyltransferase [Cyclobacteriaceae bacterium]